MFQTLTDRPRGRDSATANPWHALWAMMVGFFMILVDATIVAVANPSIMTALGAGYDAVIWVTSAYLLAYAVPLLLAGRLGDRFGPKNLYLIGLVVFTAASLWCGLAGSIEMLIAARVVQGVGAALLTPQTLSTITRIFPAEHRGVAMSVWGATAGVATLVGPLAGGVLVDNLGWQWVFIVNVPIGVIGLGLAIWLVPVLPTQKHRFDILGVVLSGVGMLLIVFALQEGQSHDWAPWVWGTIAAGVGIMVGFVYWQSVNRGEPLIPLQIFRDRDFSLSNLGVATIGFVVTAMILPLMFFAQAVCGLTPTRAALLTAPMAIATGLLAPVVGKIVDRSHPRPVIGFGFSMLAVALTWLTIEMTPTTPIWRLVLPIAAMGIGMAFIWSPLAATATRNLPSDLAGAGSGVYNAMRQVGSVLGSASMAAFMTSRISAEMPAMAGDAPQGEGSVAQLPAFLHDSFASAMSQSVLLPAFVALAGVVAALFLLGFGNAPAPRATATGADLPARPPAAAHHDGEWVDDDDYVEYTVAWDEPAAPVREAEVTTVIPAVTDAPPTDDDESVTEPLPSRTEHVLHAPAEAWHSDPVEAWHSLLDDDSPAHVAAAESSELFTHGSAEADSPAVVDRVADEVEPDTDPQPVVRLAEPEPSPPLTPLPDPAPSWSESRRNIFDGLLGDLDTGLPPAPAVEPIGFAHNGFHVDDGAHAQPVPAPDPLPPPVAPAPADPVPPPVSTPAWIAPVDPEPAPSASAPVDPLFGDISGIPDAPDFSDIPEIPDFDEIAYPPAVSNGRRSRHRSDDPQPTANGRHSRTETDDAPSGGRHSRPGYDG